MLTKKEEEEMEEELAKRMIDACYEAQKILSMMPPLPPGMTPQYMRMIEAVHDLDEKKEGARVSDIAERMRLTRPGAARSLKGLEKLGAVERHADQKDGRAVRIVLSEKGENWYRIYITRFYADMCQVLKDVSDEDVKKMIATVHLIRQKMKENREELYEGQ